ncbi:MAG: hypothetical protein KKD99_05075 [Proteobacteria bacterium]|nr:hypothetical protein [Pseudomonadota bacterium]MBU4354398.1 hypothetical protein [Pseudomonadota bacterium]MBU4447940.1 hypothetical protein [Pseudomonadota bacterium]MCG2771987.1 hypothetical protein [Desulfobacterales bacterium]
MKRQFWILLLVVMLLGLAQPVGANDGFYVIAGSRGVGKAITPTTSLPYTISQPGFYYLTGNLSYSGTGQAIYITTSEVTLDLMGFSISGPGSGGTAEGIAITNLIINNVEVRNGQVKNFYYGVDSASGNRNVRFSNLKVSGCYVGIRCVGDSIIISGCEATGNDIGLSNSGACALIDKNVAAYNNTYGFALSCNGVITNNVAYGNHTGFSLAANNKQLIDRNSSAGNSINWSNLPGCTVGLNTP